MIAALVLAAGCSTRYGPANKLLARIRGEPLLARTLRPIAAAPLRPLIVVTGVAHTRVTRIVRAELAGSVPLRIVRNRRPQAGMALSLQLGIAAVPVRCDGAMIFLGDMPHSDSRMITRLLRAWRPQLDYVRPVHRRRPGHPVLISRRLFTAIDGLEGDCGAQQILADVTPEHAGTVEMHRGCLDDADTPAAMRRLRRHDMTVTAKGR